MPIIRFVLLITTAILLPSITLAQPQQQEMEITEDRINEFRQISVRVLSAYKNQPRYVGSTDEWHLFLKKEHRSTKGKQFTSIFGYKIPRQNHPVENSWELSIPSQAIDPENCPEIHQFNKDKTGFELPAGVVTKQHCLQE